jgi:TPR repeat protein
MDKSLAAHYFKLSADQGNAYGQCNYGVCLRDGDGVVMDKSLAAHYFKLSADQGDALTLAEMPDITVPVQSRDQ